ncbi:MAG: hypothetical protein PWQ82_388 [Thermosediminibacterales bacterium]|nr:hypothetical protein [Thermosediminibacterales bacterium]
MERAQKALRRYKYRLMSMKNVLGVGIGYKISRNKVTYKPALMVLVRKKLPKQKLHRDEIIPETIAEANTDVIEVGDVKLLIQDRTAKQRPARPGISIGHYKITAGTFGAVVKDAETGEPLILSNNHVLANATDGSDGRSAIGDPILQPGPYDGGTNKDVIARLYRFVPVIKEEKATQCSVASFVQEFSNFMLSMLKPNYRVQFMKLSGKENLVDAALAKPVSQDIIRSDILELGTVKGTASAEVGLAVRKSGRSSGVTTGKIKVINATIRVLMGDSESSEYAVFANQLVTEPLAQGGDSGSLVLDENNMAVGLLFAGSEKASIVNPIDSVMEQLKVKF